MCKLKYFMCRHDGSYMFFALEPNSRYEARVQAKNQHGWSKFSELFVFSTRATGTILYSLHNQLWSSSILR
jgi:hypothetical protein